MMNQLFAKLREVDYKRFTLEHAEKTAFGMSCLLVLVCLMGTTWSRYQSNPDQFVRQVSLATNELHRSMWPNEKRAAYAERGNVMTSVQNLLTRVDAARFQYGASFVAPLNPQFEKNRAPTLLPPGQPLSKASVVILQTRAPQEEVSPKPQTPLKKTQPKKSNKTPDPTKPRQPANDTRDNPNGNADPNPSQQISNDPVQKDQVNSNQPIHTEGRRFVSVVSIVPLQQLAFSYLKALNLDSLEAAVEEVQIQSFELQRQTAVAGDDPWSGSWVPVDIEVAKQVLSNADSFDLEVVSTALTDPVITMPLPKRVAGYWDFWATHPQLIVLSQRQREQQLIINKKALQAAQDAKDVRKKRIRPGGFNEFQPNARDARRRVGARMMQKFNGEAMQQLNQTDRQPLDGQDRRANGLHAIIAGQVLLFRYLDFDVEPGNAYRYRLRLTVRNPNYNAPIEDVVDPAVTRNELLRTPWSPITNPSIVRQEQEYYLRRVHRSASRTSADINILKWYEDSGTLIQADLNRIGLGAFISSSNSVQNRNRNAKGTVAEVLRPAQKTSVDEEVAITTKDVLVDVDDTEELIVKEHTDLQLDQNDFLQIASEDEVLVVDQFGRLNQLDSVNGAVGIKRSAARIAKQKDPWLRFLKNNRPKSAPPSPLDSLIPESELNSKPDARR